MRLEFFLLMYHQEWKVAMLTWAIVIPLILIAKSKGMMGKGKVFTILAVLVALAGHLVMLAQFDDPPSTELLAKEDLSAPPSAQLAMRDSSEKLLDATTTSTEKFGKKKLNSVHSPRWGLVPEFRFPANLGVIATICNEPLWKIDEIWRNEPGKLTQMAPKAYQGKFSHREPFLDARRKMALTGQRVSIETGLTQKEPLIVWVANTEPEAKSPWKMVELPWVVGMEFDQAVFTLTGELGVNAYPQVARWAKIYLEENGLPWNKALAKMDGFADEDLEANGAPELLNPQGIQFDRALTNGEPLDRNAYGQRASLFTTGCENTPFHGQGFGKNLGALLFGEYFEKFFKSDPELAAKVALFLSANPGYRFQDDPKTASAPRLEKIKESYRYYVAYLVNIWITFGGASHPTKAVPNALQMPMGQTDPSEELIRELKDWWALTLPVNGNIKRWKEEEVDQEKRYRRTLPKLTQILGDSAFKN